MQKIGSFYKITSIQLPGYRLEWWGDDGTHFWDYRKFSTVEEAEAAAFFSRVQYTCNGYCEDAYPINNELSVCDTFYRHWLIGTSWDDELELIDPQTNEVYRLPFGDEHLSLLEEISRAKDWIDAFLQEQNELILLKKTQQDSFFTSWELIAESTQLQAKSVALIAERRALIAKSVALISERRALITKSRALGTKQ